MKKAEMSQYFFYLSISAVVLSAAQSLLGIELWLAGTQWMLVGIVMAVWALFLKK